MYKEIFTIFFITTLQMHLELDWELPYYRQEVVQATHEIKNQTTVL